MAGTSVSLCGCLLACYADFFCLRWQTRLLVCVVVCLLIMPIVVVLCGGHVCVVVYLLAMPIVVVLCGRHIC